MKIPEYIGKITAALVEEFFAVSWRKVSEDVWRMEVKRDYRVYYPNRTNERDSLEFKWQVIYPDMVDADEQRTAQLIQEVKEFFIQGEEIRWADRKGKPRILS